MIRFQGIVVHHSASHDVSVEEIGRWHNEHGWGIGCGYHYVIRKNGNIEEGRSLKLQGIHAKGKNHTHLGICVTGCFSGTPPNDTCHTYPTDKQLASLKGLLKKLMDQFNISIKKIERHHSMCPGKLPLEEILDEIKEENLQEAIAEVGIKHQPSWKRNILEILKKENKTLYKMEKNIIQLMVELDYLKERNNTAAGMIENSIESEEE